jgi:hypothetical protein
MIDTYDVKVPKHEVTWGRARSFTIQPYEGIVAAANIEEAKARAASVAHTYSKAPPFRSLMAQTLATVKVTRRLSRSEQLARKQGA